MKFLPLVFALLFLLLPTGCGPARGKARAPAATITAGDVALNQTGDAKAPAAVESNTNKTSITLPAGTTVYVDKVLGLVYRLGVDTQIYSESRMVKLGGPT